MEKFGKLREILKKKVVDTGFKINWHESTHNFRIIQNCLKHCGFSWIMNKYYSQYHILSWHFSITIEHRHLLQ